MRCRYCEDTGWCDYAHFAVACRRCKKGRKVQNEQDKLEIQALEKELVFLRERVQAYEKGEA